MEIVPPPQLVEVQIFLRLLELNWIWNLRTFRLSLKSVAFGERLL